MDEREDEGDGVVEEKHAHAHCTKERRRRQDNQNRKIKLGGRRGGKWARETTANFVVHPCHSLYSPSFSFSSRVFSSPLFSFFCFSDGVCLCVYVREGMSHKKKKRKWHIMATDTPAKKKKNSMEIFFFKRYRMREDVQIENNKSGSSWKRHFFLVFSFTFFS